MPAVLRTMNRPAERRALKICVGHFQRRLVAQNLSRHFDISMKRCPVQRGGAVLPHRIYRPARRQHQSNGREIVVPRRAGDVALVGSGEARDKSGVLPKQ